MKFISKFGKLVALAIVSALLGIAAYGAATAQPGDPNPVPQPGDASDGNPNPAVYLPFVQGSGSAPNAEGQLYIFNVYVKSPADVAVLTNSAYDVLESRGADYLQVLGEASVAESLRAAGFRVEINQTLAAIPKAEPGKISPMTYYGGYRTVVEHYAHLDSVATAYPNLTTVFDYGDSYRKVNGIANGHDLKVICITNKATGDCVLNLSSAKPRFLVVAAIHARELTVAEVAYRYIDYLTQNYNVDADITALLDHNEVWVAPLLNPDGRFIVEQGGNSPYLQRKNARPTGNCANPPTSSNQNGVDLNRNANFKWGGLGSTTSVCAQTYRGTAAASEPEQQALEALMANLFPDQRGPADTDPAPSNTKGAMITLHSYSNLVILPWGFVECNATACPPSQQAPNNAGLRSFAFRMSFYNGYTTGQGSEILYATTGTTDDWAYGVLGIPAFTFELGPSSGTCSGFTPAYSCVDSTFWPLNRPALLYAAKNVRQPYVSTLGPNAINLNLSASSVVQGASATLNATINDAQYGSNGFGIPTAQTVDAAEYYIDTPPWAGGTAVALNASDGTFNATNEGATASINTSSLSVGRHTIFVRGRDSAGNWGATSAIWLTVTDPSAPTPTPTPLPTATPTPTPSPTPGPGPIFSDNFETNLGWTTNASGTDTATAGQWERGDPAGTSSSGTTLQLNTTASGVNDLVTGRLAGNSAGVYDVDGGLTSIRSPAIALPGSGTITLSFKYYLAHLNNASNVDYFRVKIVGATTTTVFESLAAPSTRAGVWTNASANISAFAGQSVRILIECADTGSASLIECGVDDVVIQ
jgi:hypothetical protein